MPLTLEEARGIAAQIWMKPNYRRRPLDAGLCEDIANLLVDETIKASDGHEKIALDFHNQLNVKEAEIEKLKSENLSLLADRDQLEAKVQTLEKAVNNLSAEKDALVKEKKDEVV